MRKKILLTGASGFVGRNFLNLYSQDFDIRTVNLRNDDIEKISYNKIDCIIHCAALVHQMRGAPEQEYFKINYELTKKLADKAKAVGVKHFIFLSTAHVYGDSGSLYDHQTRLSEDSPCFPQDAYGKSKLAAEKYLQSIESSNFVVSIIRPPMVYGKNAKGNILKLAKLIKLCPFLPFNYTINKRSIIFVGNLCHFIALTANKKVSGVLLPQDTDAVSLATLINEIASAMNKKVYLMEIHPFLLNLIFKIAKKLSLRLYGSLAFDSRQSNNRLGYSAKYTTKEGLKNLINKGNQLIK